MSKSTVLPSRARGYPEGHKQSPKNGQAGMEFMILFILFMVAIVIAMVVSVNRTQFIADAQMSLEANRVLSDVADRINIAYIEGDGFSMNVTLPQRILRTDYTLEISSNEAILRSDRGTFIKSLLTNNVTGTPVKGTNTIANSNGQIVITGGMVW